MPNAAALASPLCNRAVDELTTPASGPAWMRLASVSAPRSEPPHAPIWEATGAPQRTAALPGVAAEREHAILAALLAPIDARDGHRVGNDRKELALRALFAALPVLEAMELHRRLRAARADDAVVAAFGRLVVERRQRLIAFLGDARRRAALAR